MKRLSKRALKRLVLREAMELYRGYDFPIQRVILSSSTNPRRLDTVTARLHAQPFHVLDSLLHTCAVLDGDLPQ